MGTLYPDDLPQHPSHGNIQISRIQGHRTLYASPIDSLGFVRISIALDRPFDSGGTRHHAQGKNVVEVDLTEVQFAHAITCMNQGSGSACTLVRYPDLPSKPIPEAPRVKSNAESTADHIKTALGEKVAELRGLRDDLRALLEDAKVSQKKQGPIVEKVQQALRVFEDSVPFYIKEFDEHVDKTVMTAKAEVAAFANAEAHRTGVAALKQGVVLELAEAKEEE